MPKLYVITDTTMKVDAFVYMQSNDGAAGSYFYNWCLMQQHRKFELSTIGEVSYSDNQYLVTDIDRKFICAMPEDEHE